MKKHTFGGLGGSPSDVKPPKNRCCDTVGKKWPPNSESERSRLVLDRFCVQNDPNMDVKDVHFFGLFPLWAPCWVPNDPGTPQRRSRDPIFTHLLTPGTPFSIIFCYVSFFVVTCFLSPGTPCPIIFYYLFTYFSLIFSPLGPHLHSFSIIYLLHFH